MGSGGKGLDLHIAHRCHPAACIELAESGHISDQHEVKGRPPAVKGAAVFVHRRRVSWRKCELECCTSDGAKLR